MGITRNAAVAIMAIAVTMLAGCGGSMRGDVEQTSLTEAGAEIQAVGDDGATLPTDAQDRRDRYLLMGWTSVPSGEALVEALGLTLPIPSEMLDGRLTDILLMPEDSEMRGGFVAYDNGVSLNVFVYPNAAAAGVAASDGGLTDEPGFREHVRLIEVRGVELVASEAFDAEPVLGSDGSAQEGRRGITGTSVKWRDGSVVYGILKDGGSPDDLVPVAESMLAAAGS